MYIINKKEGGHDWEKQNGVNFLHKGRIADKLKCKKCGITGHSYTFETIELKGSYSSQKVYNCPSAKPVDVPKRIKITQFTGIGRHFANLTPDSEHDIVEPPEGEKHDLKGVWVMGVGEPVKVLNHEFVEL